MTREHPAPRSRDDGGDRHDSRASPSAASRERMLELPEALVGRLHILACPDCSAALVEGTDALICGGCNAVYPVRGGKIYFAKTPKHKTAEAGIKEWLKRLLGQRYNQAVRLIAPVYPYDARRVVSEFIDPSKSVVVDVGSGPQRIHQNVITVDLVDYESVDLVSSLERLPFAAHCVDAFVSSSVLEHLEDPFAVVANLFRATRDGGLGIHNIPFLYHFHEAPRDFLRMTSVGAQVLFKKWELIRVFNTTGPVSLFLSLWIELLATILSFGNGRIKEALYLCLSGVLFPLKYLDWAFVRRARFLSLAPTFCVVVRKPAPED